MNLESQRKMVGKECEHYQVVEDTESCSDFKGEGQSETRNWLWLEF